MKKFIIMLVFIVSLGVNAYLLMTIARADFSNFNPEQMYQQIIGQRQLAITRAKERGEYKCCIKPSCTMCYDSQNKWNYNQPGKCFCDDFIARGEEPCPQCKKSLTCESGIHGADTAFCETNLTPKQND